MYTQENIVLTPAQYNELSSFVDNAKYNLETINSFLSSFKSNGVNVNVNVNGDLNVKSKVNEIVKRNEQSNIDYDSTNSSIKSEKQWFICNSDPESETGSNWISNRGQLLSQFVITSPASFLNLLERTQAVVAGGFAVNCLFGFDLKNYNGDMDIFLTEKIWKKDDDIKEFKNFFYNQGYSITLDVNTKTSDLSEHYGVNQECPKDMQKSTRIVEAYKSLNKISRMVVFSKTINGIQKDIQVIFTEYDCIRSHIRTFDMSICQTFFDHKNLYTRFKYHQLTLNRVNMLLKKDVNVYEDIKYLKRIYKYQSRGFRTYFDPSLNSQFRVGKPQSPEFQTIDDAILRISQIDALLEWYQQDPQNSPVIPVNSLQGKKILCYNVGRNNQICYYRVSDNMDTLTLKVSFDQHLRTFFISTDNPFIKEDPVMNVTLLVDTDYKILFIEEQLRLYKSIIEQENELYETDYNTSSAELIKDPIEYLENKIEKNIKKMMSVHNINKNGNNTNSIFPLTLLTLYAKNLFGWLTNPLYLFKNTDRIGNPFKHKYTELFNTYVDILQENILQLKETNTDYTNIQTIIQSIFMNYIFENIKDVRWLLSLMLVYPDLFKFTEAHYKAAVNNNVARDNLYLIKKELKQNL
jgi:hypothetical protein